MRNTAGRARFAVLIASSDVPYATALVRYMEIEGYDLTQCHDAKGVLRLVRRQDFDVVVLDLDLAKEGGVDLVSFIRRQSVGTLVILLFDIRDIDRAVEAIRQGAFFYLPKEVAPSDVGLLVEKAVQSIQQKEAVGEYEQRLFEEMAGSAPAMKRVTELITKVAPTDSTVLLLGESGTGKEVLANAIHRLSPRREMPFVAVNCAALPENLLESELFGHEKGAFTGADADKQGLFEAGDGGTVFLDEIGDMALTTQAKLLRVLQNGEIRRVGSTTPGKVDVRVIAATNRDLIEAVGNKTFREDLYFRLNVVQIRIPPLRERMDALPRLVEHFIQRHNARFGKHVRGLDDAAQALLRDYSYPGNVRELESIIAHGVIMSDGDFIQPKDLPQQVHAGRVNRLALPGYSADVPSLDEMTRDLIASALDAYAGNQTEVAKRLGISRSTLWRKMKEYGIAPKQTPGDSV